MRLSDYGEDEPRSLGIVGLGLTEREAREVLDAITSLLASPRNNHVHVSSDDYQTEVRVFIVDDEGEMLM